MDQNVYEITQSYQQIPAFSDLEFGDCGSRKKVVRDIENAVAMKPLHYDPANFNIYEQSVHTLINNTKLHTIQRARTFLKTEQTKNKIIYSGPILLWTYRQMCKKGEFDKYNHMFDSILRTKTFRSLDGVLVVTVFMPGFPEVLLKKGEDPVTVLGDSIDVDMDTYKLNRETRIKKISMGEKVNVDYDMETIGLARRQFSCRHDCLFCPSQEGMPRSYLEREPGVKRATDLPVPYDILQQMWTRLDQYFLNGHPIDKLEILVLGGTFNSYPKIIRKRFIQGMVYAANTFFDPHRLTNPRPCDTLEKEWFINRDNPCKAIGLTIETRPDYVLNNFLREIRELQVTRIQVGVQHSNDKVLERVNRGHTYKTAITAFQRIQDGCMKGDAHLMPDLCKYLTNESKMRIDKEVAKLKKAKMTKEEYRQAVIDIEDSIAWKDLDHSKPMIVIDREMFDVVLYKNGGLGFDQVKYYPHQVVDYTRTKKWYMLGLHKSYFEEIIFPTYNDHVRYLNMNKTEQKKYHLHNNPLFYLMCDVLEETHPWIRVNRLIRDIPNEYIKGGNDCANYRQLIESELINTGRTIHELRHCEKMARPKISDDGTIKDVDCHLMAHKYITHDGINYFICFCNEEHTKVFGFLRLRISDKTSGFEELDNAGKIREVHVYGQLVETDVKRDSHIQHSGMGSQLLDAAEFLSLKHGRTRMAIVAGNGTYNYYSKFGYTEPSGSSFMIKELDPTKIKMNELMIDSHSFPVPRLRVVKRYLYQRIINNKFSEQFNKEIITDYRKRYQVIDYRIREIIQRKYDTEFLKNLFVKLIKIVFVSFNIYVIIMIIRILNETF